MLKREKRKSERLGALFHFLRMNADKPVTISRLATALAGYYLDSSSEDGKRPRKLRDTLHRDMEAFLAAGVVISRNGDDITYHSPAKLNVNLDEKATALLADLTGCLPSRSLAPLFSFAFAGGKLSAQLRDEPRAADSSKGTDSLEGADSSEKDSAADERPSNIYARGKVRLGIPPGAHSLAMASAVAHRILCVITYHGHRYYLVPSRMTRAYKALYVQAWALLLADGRDAPLPSELPPVGDDAWMARTFRIDRIEAVRMVELYSGSLPEVGEGFAFSTDVTLAYHRRDALSALKESAHPLPPLLLRAASSAPSSGHVPTYRLTDIETNFLLEELVAYRGELTLAEPAHLKRQLQESLARLTSVVDTSAALNASLAHPFTPYESRRPQAATIAPFYKALELVGYVSTHGPTALHTLGEWSGLPWKCAATLLINAALIDDAEHFIPFDLHLPSFELDELTASSVVSISFPQDVSLAPRVEEVVLLVNVIDAALEIEGRRAQRNELMSVRNELTTALKAAHMEALIWPAPPAHAGMGILAGLADALEEEREITFRYLRVGNEQDTPHYSREEFVPGMIEVGPRSYLLGLKDGEFRRYRLDRITDLHVGNRRRARGRRASTLARKHAHLGLATYPTFRAEGDQVHLLLKPQGLWLLDTLADVSIAEGEACKELASQLPAALMLREEVERSQLVSFNASSLSWLASVLIQAAPAVAYVGPAPVARRLLPFLGHLALVEESE